MIGAVNADGQRYAVLEHQDHEGHRQRQIQPVHDDAPHRAPVLKGVAEVALGEDVLHPVEVLDKPGVVQAVLQAQGGNVLGGEHLALGRHGRHVGGHVVSRGQLDDEEDHEGDDQQRRDEEKQSLANVFQHIASHLSTRRSLKKCERRFPQGRNHLSHPYSTLFIFVLRIPGDVTPRCTSTARGRCPSRGRCRTTRRSPGSS